MAILLRLTQSALDTSYPMGQETGMGFQILQASLPNSVLPIPIVLRSDGLIVPLIPYREYFTIGDWLKREPETEETVRLDLLEASESYPDRASALLALTDVTLPPGYVPTAGAVPLIGSVTLGCDSVLYRYCWSAHDPAFTSGALARGTYLTSRLDTLLANSGFGTVGRYALPIPAPANHLFQYAIPAGATLRVGTVSPMFGQAGGGVELKLDSLPPKTGTPQLGHVLLSSF